MTRSEAYHLKRGDKPLPGQERVCAVCPTTFQLFNEHEVKRKKYCSVECQRAVSGRMLGDRMKAGLTIVPTKALKPREERRCEGCGEPFLVKAASHSFRDVNRRFCSRACSYEAVIRGRFRGESSGKWVEKVSFACEACGDPFQVIPSQAEGTRACSKECANLLLERVTSFTCQHCGDEMNMRPSRANRRKYCSRQCRTAAMPMADTSIERKIEAYLKALSSVGWEKHYPLSRFSVDFAIPEKKVFIECDGTYWHSLPAAIKRDAQKDRLAAERGWTMIRLPEKAINGDLAGCYRRIREALST